MLTIIVVAVVAVLLAFLLGTIYNKLVRLRERTRSSFAQIDVQLERRHDLIPNLVETAKAYLQHERETLEEVVRARAASTQARIEVSGDPQNLAAMERLGASEGALGGALSRLLALAEAYPDLKANQTMAQLTEELTVTEDRIAYSRQNYNDQVNDYQTYKASFPAVFLANPFGFADSAYLDLDDQAHKRAPIQVSFDDPPADPV